MLVVGLILFLPHFQPSLKFFQSAPLSREQNHFSLIENGESRQAPAGLVLRRLSHDRETPNSASDARLGARYW